MTIIMKFNPFSMYFCQKPLNRHYWKLRKRLSLMKLGGSKMTLTNISKMNVTVGNRKLNARLFA